MSETATPPSFNLAVIMERLAINNRWQSHRWQLVGVVADDGLHGSLASATVIATHEGSTQVLHPGHVVTVFADEAEGYYLNVTAPEPRVFVLWRMLEEVPEDSPGHAAPHTITLSYNEAARWMDAQEKVDGVAMPPDIFNALTAWVAANYKPPEKKNRVRPQSFESKDGRYRGGMSS